jgi:hypothetical protein
VQLRVPPEAVGARCPVQYAVVGFQPGCSRPADPGCWCASSVRASVENAEGASRSTGVTATVQSPAAQAAAARRDPDWVWPARTSASGPTQARYVLPRSHEPAQKAARRGGTCLRSAGWRLNTARKASALVWAVRAGCGRAGLGCFGEPGVQPLADLLRGVGAAAALRPGDHHSAGGDASEGC